MLVQDRTIRLFVSSTFSDLKTERNALQREVFPRLKQLCLSKGLRFQAIDLRWGVPEEAGKDNRTMRICLRELTRCQQDRPKPNFLILLGDRYGWRPLPETVPVEVFEELRRRLTADHTDDTDVIPLMDTCYRRDDNAVPPEYVLQPREGRFAEFAVWEAEVERPLLAALTRAANSLRTDPATPASLREAIDAVAIGSSATEQEIIAGALKVTDAATHVRAFFRTIDGLPNPPPQEFVETGEAADRLKELKTRIGKHIGTDGISDYHVPWRTSVAPSPGGPTSPAAVTETSGIHPDGLKDFCDQAWKQLSAVVEQQIAALATVSPDEQEEQAHQAFGKERCRHFVGRREPLERIAEYLRQGSGPPLAVIGPSGSGKSAVMAKAVEAVGDRENGHEKAQKAQGGGKFAQGNRTEVIARYIGATPASADVTQLLRNIVGEIRKRYPAPVAETAQDGGSQAPATAEAMERVPPKQPGDSDIPYEFNPLVNAFHEALQRPTADKPLFLFLDALDQLTAGNNAHSLAWLPAKLSDHVRLVVSAALPPQGDTGILPVNPGGRATPRVVPSDPHLPTSSADPRATIINALESRLGTGKPRSSGAAVGNGGVGRPPSSDSAFVLLTPLTPADGELMLENWLDDAGRKLQPPQRDAVLAAFAHEGSPLWLRTAAEEAARLVSWDPAPAFALTTQGLLGQVLERLSREDEHGDKLVSRTLSYLACARHGLAEDEILDILSADPEVMADFRRRSPNSPKADILPVAVWVRLHGDLAFYLAEHQAQGASRLGFYHRSFLEAVTVRDLASPELRQARHQHLADWFGKQGWFIAPSVGEAKAAQGTISDPPNARKASEFPWHLYKTADAADPERHQEAVWQPLADVLCGLLFVEAKVRAELVLELQEDYRFALQALPEAQAEVEKEREGQERTARWTREIIAYAQAWSSRRDRLARAEQMTEPEPTLPTPPPSCRMWTEEEIETECKRIIANPTRLDRLRAFAGFVESQCYPLIAHCQRPEFARQHAFNTEPAGAVHDAARPLLATLSAPHLLRRWPPEARPNPKPALLRTLEGAGVFSVSVTLDGRRAISGGVYRTLRVWDLEMGVCLRTLKGHNHEINSVSVTPDGRRAVSGSSDKTLLVWDLESGVCLRMLRGHGEAVKSVSVTPDGHRAVSGSLDKTIRVWDLGTGECVRTLRGHSTGVNSVSVTPDGRRAVSGSNGGTLRVWDLETGVCQHTLEGHRHWVTSLSVTPDGSRAISGSWDKTLRVWDLASGACLRTLEGHSNFITCVSVTPDGRRAISGGYNNTLRVWDLENAACLRTLEGHTSEIRSVSVTPDGRRAVSSDNGTLRVWALESKTCLGALERHSDAVSSVSVTPDGRYALSGSDDGTLRVWDLKSGACLRTLKGHSDNVKSVSVTPDGRRAVSGSSDSTLRVWDLESGACVGTLEGDKHWVESVSVTPDGRRAVSGSLDHTMRVWDLESGMCLRTLKGHSSDVKSVGVTPDGRWTVSGSDDKTARVWDIESGVCLRTLEGHSDRINSVSVTPDGLRVVSGSDDRTLRVWSLESGVCLRTLEGHSSGINSVSVTPDGRHAVSGGWDDTLRVWDLESGTCVGVFSATSSVEAAAVFWRTAAFGTRTGEVLFVDMREMPSGLGIVTMTQFPDEPEHGFTRVRSKFLSFFRRFPLRPDLGTGRHSVRCPQCGTVFEPAVEVVSAIELLSDSSRISDLPDTACVDNRVVSTCPHCAQPLSFNPFVVDASDAAYEALLRRGLENCRQTRGDEESTLGHLGALALHLRKKGEPAEAAHLRREHDEMAARIGVAAWVKEREKALVKTRVSALAIALVIAGMVAEVVAWAIAGPTAWALTGVVGGAVAGLVALRLGVKLESAMGIVAAEGVAGSIAGLMAGMAAGIVSAAGVRVEPVIGIVAGGCVGVMALGVVAGILGGILGMVGEWVIVFVVTFVRVLRSGVAGRIAKIVEKARE